jgi:dihydroorotate dehydrogenase subfamily 1
MMDFAGVQFKNPFVVASSPLTATVEMLREAQRAGAAAVSTKLTFIKQPFYGQLRMYSDRRVGSIVCHDRRLDLDEGVRLVEEGKRATSLVIFTNITYEGKDLDGWVTLATAMEEAGADLIEANMICPNLAVTAKRLGKADLGGGALVGQDPGLVREITAALKSAVSIPVVCKLTPNVTDITEVALACQEAGADGITLAGAQLSLPPVDIYHPDRVYPQLKGASYGSLGGPSCRLIGYAALAQTAQAIGIPIVGGGGIDTWRHAVEYMMWGATLATACTSIMWRGWEVVTKIVRGVDEFMAEQGYTSYDELVGLALSNIRANVELEPLPGAPVLNPELCNGCGLCTKPGHCTAIVLEDGLPVITAELCKGCSICVALCPRGALSFPETS